MPKELFITATGTDIGKTFILEKRLRELVKQGQKCRALKPVISGFLENQESDTLRILKALNMPIEQENITKISPWRFKAATSPNIAARMENKEVNFSELISFCKRQQEEAKNNAEYFFIEGAGGIMSPITDKHSFIDLMKQLKIPALLVIGDYLGTISHTLSALTALKHYDIAVAEIVINCRKNNWDGERILPELLIETLRNFTACPLTFA